MNCHFVFLLYFSSLCSGVNSVDDFGPVKMTVLNTLSVYRPDEKLGIPGYQIYLSEPDITAVLTVGREFKIAATETLPADHRAHTYDEMFRVVDLPLSPGEQPFGVYYATGTAENRESKITTTVINENATILPVNTTSSVTVSVGERLKIGFTGLESTTNIEWRKNGNIFGLSTNGDMLTFNSVTLDNAGIYEAYPSGQRSLRKHSFIKVIVRACPSGKWGPPSCLGICDNCYNGGVCEVETGICICPPGFVGNNCLTACGGNRFGWGCEYRCTWSDEDPKDKCGLQLCLPDPFGCQCAAGFTGINCRSECPVGTYGAGCKQVCHCKSGSCNRYTGACSECMNSWNGESCQIPDVCPDGYYGDQCIKKCHCKDDKSCDKNTGHCINGQCAVGYTLSDASICEPCAGDSYGDGCDETCNCHLDYCHNVRGCWGDCFDYWLAPSCTIGIVGGGYDKCNSGEPTNFTCSVTGNLTGVDVRLQYQSSLSSSLSPVTLSPVTVVTTDGILLARFIADTVVTHNYSCRIEDDKYWTTRALNVDVYDQPGYNGKPSVLNSTNSSVTLKWRPWSTDEGDTGDGPVIDYVVFYKRARDQERNSVSTSGLTSVEVKGLLANTEYEFSVAAVRPYIGGRGETRVVLTSTTLCSPPVTPFTTLTNGDMLRQLTVNWSVPHVDIGCPITFFTIYYSELGFEDDETHIVVNKTVREYTIIYLDAFTAYNVEFTSRNKDYESLRSSNIAYTTEEKSPPPIVSVCSDSPTTLHIETNGLGIFGNVTHFNIRYREENVRDETWQLVKLDSNDGSATWIGDKITTGKAYVVQVRAVNGLGEGRWSKNFSVISRRAETSDLIVMILYISLGLSLICNAFFLIHYWIMRYVSSNKGGLENSRNHLSNRNDVAESHYEEMDTKRIMRSVSSNKSGLEKSRNHLSSRNNVAESHYEEMDTTRILKFVAANTYSETEFPGYGKETIENEIFKEDDAESIYAEMDAADYLMPINILKNEVA